MLFGVAIFDYNFMFQMSRIFILPFVQCLLGTVMDLYFDIFMQLGMVAFRRKQTRSQKILLGCFLILMALLFPTGI